MEKNYTKKVSARSVSLHLGVVNSTPLASWGESPTLIAHVSARVTRTFSAETLVSAHLDVSSRGAADAGSAVGRVATYAVHRSEQHQRAVRPDRVSHAQVRTRTRAEMSAK